MPPKTLAQSGAAIMLAAVLLFWETGLWLNTGTLKPVDMTISLDAGRIQTGDFGINLREKFQVYILLDPSIDDYWTDGRCNLDSLPEMNWKVFQLPNQKRSEFWVGSESRRPSEGYVGEFPAVPGTYRFELQISKATGRLNVRHPHLQISTPSRDCAEICNCLLYLWLFVAGLGAVLVLSGIWGWKRERLSILSATRIFPETPLRNVIALKRHRPTLVILDLSMFGPTWFGVIAALSVVFLLYLTKPLMRYGLPIDFPKHYAATGKSPWPETLGVYVDAHRRFHVNGELTKPENLEQKLREELGRRIVWTVYVEGDGDSVFEDTVFAMDAVQGLGGKVVWITPMMRKEWTAERPLLQTEKEQWRKASATPKGSGNGAALKALPAVSRRPLRKNLTCANV
jgi:biopolymer transport protein ExbD